MIHETYECDRCHTKEPKPEALKKSWESTWTTEQFHAPSQNRQKALELKLLLCPKCTNFLEAHLARFLTEATDDAVFAALFRKAPGTGRIE